MPVIKLITVINAPIEACFDKARSIDAHQLSMEHTDERAVAGVITGLINLNETVTWKARHFGVNMCLTSKITEFEYPVRFTDEMLEGPFKMIKHRHLFSKHSGRTIMTDEFEFKSPYGFLGSIVNAVFLKRYMKKLLIHRNECIKSELELQHSH